MHSQTLSHFLFRSLVQSDLQQPSCSSAEPKAIMEATISSMELVSPEESASNSLASLFTDVAVQTNIEFGLLIDELHETKVKLGESEALLKQVGNRFSPENMSDEHLLSFTGFNKATFFKVFSFLNITPDLDSKALAPQRQFFLFLARLKTGVTLKVLSFWFEVKKNSFSSFL